MVSLAFLVRVVGAKSSHSKSWCTSSSPVCTFYGMCLPGNGHSSDDSDSQNYDDDDDDDDPRDYSAAKMTAEQQPPR